MPRPLRVFVEGGIYHVYNRVTRDERVFAEDQEAALLLNAMRDARDRDGLIVLAQKGARHMKIVFWLESVDMFEMRFF